MMSVQQGRDGARIVVGVDGSDSSRQALAWAVKQAELTGADVEAVAAWEIPVAYGYNFYSVLAVPDLEKAAGKVLDGAVSEVAAAHPDVKIRQILVKQSAARALIDAAKGADLLVVGSRGHAGFTEALLGSVGQHCVHHAQCPVVVVRSRVAAG
jgi:nucleotide-binding universal stress UspA family protein